MDGLQLLCFEPSSSILSFSVPDDEARESASLPPVLSLYEHALATVAQFRHPGRVSSHLAGENRLATENPTRRGVSTLLTFIWRRLHSKQPFLDFRCCLRIRSGGFSPDPSGVAPASFLLMSIESESRRCSELLPTTFGINWECSLGIRNGGQGMRREEWCRNAERRGSLTGIFI